jgi:hypothetical protein
MISTQVDGLSPEIREYPRNNETDNGPDHSELHVFVVNFHMANSPQPEGFTWAHFATVAIGAILTIVPQIIPGLPPTWRDSATVIFAAATGLWHLYTPPPTNEK